MQPQFHPRGLAAILSLSLAFLAGACSAGDNPMDPIIPNIPIPMPVPTPVDPAKITDVSGDITADALWSGGIRLVADAHIAAGVTVTVDGGSALLVAEGVALTVEGTLLVNGSEAEPVSIAPDDGAMSWIGIQVMSGGTASIHWTDASAADVILDCQTGAVTCDLDHVYFHDANKAVEYRAPGDVSYSTFGYIGNAGFNIRIGGDVLVSDSVFFESSHDIIVQSGGALAIDHSEIGLIDTYEHCEIHVGTGDAFSLTNSIIHGGVYGVMFGGVNGGVINYNNFESNGTDVWDLGGALNVDVRYNWWEAGAPPAGNGSIPGMLPPEYDTSDPAATPYPDAGPRSK